jgi:hypothetical protein
MTSLLDRRIELRNAAIKTGLAANCTAIRASALVIWRSGVLRGRA